LHCFAEVKLTKVWTTIAILYLTRLFLFWCLSDLFHVAHFAYDTAFPWRSSIFDETFLTLKQGWCYASRLILSQCASPMLLTYHICTTGPFLLSIGVTFCSIFGDSLCRGCDELDIKFYSWVTLGSVNGSLVLCYTCLV
jgi:hypothetical protein